MASPYSLQDLDRREDSARVDNPRGLRYQEPQVDRCGAASLMESAVHVRVSHEMLEQSVFEVRPLDQAVMHCDLRRAPVQANRRADDFRSRPYRLRRNAAEMQSILEGLVPPDKRDKIVQIVIDVSGDS